MNFPLDTYIFIGHSKIICCWFHVQQPAVTGQQNRLVDQEKDFRLLKQSFHILDDKISMLKTKRTTSIRIPQP